jgi:hypothetical protein
MARPMSMGENMVVSVRIEKETYSMLQELASLESLHAGRTVSVNDLIRKAINFTYSDNERLRECFRKTRTHINKIMKKKD